MNWSWLEESIRSGDIFMFVSAGTGIVIVALSLFVVAMKVYVWTCKQLQSVRAAGEVERLRQEVELLQVRVDELERSARAEPVFSR